MCKKFRPFRPYSPLSLDITSFIVDESMDRMWTNKSISSIKWRKMEMSLAEQLNLFGGHSSPIKMPVASPVVKVNNSNNRETGTLKELAGRVYTDYYHELSPDDSDIWLILFEEADKVSEELCAVLMYLRGGGVRLLPSPRFGFIIRPVIGKNGWPTAEAYDAEKAALNTYKDKLLKLLKELPSAIKKRGVIT